MTQTDLPLFARQVLRFRKARDLTAQELAKRAGVSRDTIASIETGRKRQLTVDQLVRLGWGLQVSPTSLLVDLRLPDAQAFPGTDIPLTVTEAADWFALASPSPAPAWTPDALIAKALRGLHELRFKATVLVSEYAQLWASSPAAADGGKAAFVLSYEALLELRERHLEDLAVAGAVVPPTFEYLRPVEQAFSDALTEAEVLRDSGEGDPQ